MKLHIKENSISYEGVRKAWDKEHYLIDFDKDLDNDIILLTKDTSGEYKSDNLTYYYGYRFNSKCSQKEQAEFRTALKHKMDSKAVFYSNSVHDFVENGLYKMDELKRLNDFGVVISTANSYSEQTLTGKMCQICFDLINSEAEALNMRLLKKLCQDVTFDEERARAALRKTRSYGGSEESIDEVIESLKNQFEKAIEEGGLFKIKRYQPVAGRAGFIDFLKFANEREQHIYETLREGTEVLICEDFITSGSTVNEIIRFLNTINPKNKISVFVLIDQLRHT